MQLPDDLDLTEVLAEPTPEQEAIAAVLRDLDALVQLHQPSTDFCMGYRDEGVYGLIEPACRTCGTPDEYATAWPCRHHEDLTRIRRTLTREDHHV